MQFQNILTESDVDTFFEILLTLISLSVKMFDLTFTAIKMLRLFKNYKLIPYL